MGLALRLALREMRCDIINGLAGFRIFLACLALGVGGIAGIGSLGAALNAGLESDAAKMLGGDLEFSLPDRDLPAQAVDWLRQWGQVSEVVGLRGMARPMVGEQTILVAAKAVDAAYPLYGTVDITGSKPLARVLDSHEGVPGMAADQAVLDRLGLHLGDRLRLGAGIFELRAILRGQPDDSGLFDIGAPVIVSMAGLTRSGLDLPGILATHAWRLRLTRPSEARAILAAANTRFPDADWQAREARTASPVLSGFIGQTDTMMVLVGLAALLLGGIGVAQAIAAHLARRRSTIAVLKCLGGSSALIAGIYFAEIMTIAVLGIVLGVATGSALPWVVSAIVHGRLPIPIQTGFYLRPLGLAALCGVLVSLAALAWSLAGISRVSAAAQLRGPIQPVVSWRDRAPTLFPLIFLAGLMIWTGSDPGLTIRAGTGVLVALVVFAAIGYAIIRFAGVFARLAPVASGLAIRLGLANLSRPGAPTQATVLALGLGLSVLVAITAIDGSLEHLMRDALPKRAPSLFFIDIQPDQTAPFAALARSVSGIDHFETTPSLRTRVVKLNGRPLDSITLDPGARRIIDGDRGLTYAAQLPAGSRVVTGAWWPLDYQGPPLLSLDASLADDLHLKLGDTMTLNVAGREITARIANTRHIDWSSLGINFFIVMAPGTLEPAPQTHIATVHADTPRAQEQLEDRVVSAFPNVSAIPIAAAIAKLTAALTDLMIGIRAMAGLLLIAGLLVLVSIEAAARDRRVDEAGLLQLLGADRFLLARSYLVEFGVLGVLLGLSAGGIGMLGAWFTVAKIMQIPWTASIFTIALIPICVLPPTMLIGFAGTWLALAKSRRIRARF